MRAAHRVGFRTTATIMFGHIEGYRHWARHLLRVRELQAETGGFTEFVPLPFVHMEAPIYLKGRARPGPTFREAVLMHAVARLALHPLIPNIQASWVKMGAEGVRHCLRGRRQRSRRHADGRKHHALRRRLARPGNDAAGDGADHRARPGACRGSAPRSTAMPKPALRQLSFDSAAARMRRGRAENRAHSAANA